mgnify:CR=1 FL=1
MPGMDAKRGRRELLTAALLHAPSCFEYRNAGIEPGRSGPPNRHDQRNLDRVQLLPEAARAPAEPGGFSRFRGHLPPHRQQNKGI